MMLRRTSNVYGNIHSFKYSHIMVKVGPNTKMYASYKFFNSVSVK